MKKIKANLGIIMMLLLFCSTSVFAQEEIKKEKKVVIVTKKVDENGNVTTDKIVKEGEDANVWIKDSDDNGDQNNEEINIDVRDNGDEKVIKIKTGKGDDASVEVFKIKGEMSEEMKAKLKEKGVFIHEGGKHKEMKFKSSDAPNQACLGVMIGSKVTVENNNGEETTTTEGESDLGVPVLDIIEGSGAEDAGLLKDDIITQINNVEVSSVEDVTNALAPMEVGATITVSYLRNDQAAEVTATLKACGSSDNEEEEIEIEEEVEWTNDDGEEMEIEGENIFFIEEGSEGMQDNKIIIKKRKGDGTEVIEEIEVAGESEMEEDFEFGPANSNTLDIQTIDIFPNPTDGKLTLEFTAPKNVTTVQLTDVTGKEVFSETIKNFDGTYKKEIDLSKVAKGALVLLIKQGEKVFSERIMVQ